MVTLLLIAGATSVFVPNSAASSPPADAKVTDQAYVRHDGGSDATISSCSVNNRQQNEPAAAMAPHNPALLTSGSNDYCTVPTSGGTWAGFAYSANGGSSWVNSLLPGYPTDTSAAGQASPIFGLATNAGDPVQAWDNNGHLYYAGIAFNRAKPAFGSIWVARYNWASGSAPAYERTTLVERGTPSPIFLGLFHDKIQLEVDRGANSPYAGSIYVCWARFTASGPNNGVFLARSSDGGQNFSSQKISESVHGSQFCDVAVTSSGAVYVAWRQFDFKPEQGQLQNNAVAWVRSNDGGKSFTKPATAAAFTGWDPGDATINGAAYGQAKYDACQVGDGTLGGCATPEPRATARDCGDGALACQSGYVFARGNSQVRIAADPTASGNANEAFIVFDASVPGTQRPSGTSYGTLGSGVASQSGVYLIKTGNAGASWSAPSRVDPQAKGHQIFPDVAADGGKLHVMWQDSRDDLAAGPDSHWSTAPIGNRHVAANPPGGVSAGDDIGVDAYYAVSSNGGSSWAISRASTSANNPSYEQFGNRDVPFFGDYNSIAAVGSHAFLTWTDNRDTVLGSDPRYPVDGLDGFDVVQCRALLPSGEYGPDTCPDSGGLDQNIYGAVFS